MTMKNLDLLPRWVMIPKTSQQKLRIGRSIGITPEVLNFKVFIRRVPSHVLWMQFMKPEDILYISVPSFGMFNCMAAWPHGTSVFALPSLHTTPYGCICCEPGGSQNSWNAAYCSL